MKSAMLTPEDIARRQEALRKARVNSLIDGHEEHPDDAIILDACARGEFDADEARQRVLARAGLTTGCPVIGSGNFLADRGYANPDEARAKFRLANEIALLIDDLGLTSTEAGELAGVTPADIEKIEAGRISGFSMEVLNAITGKLKHQA